MEEPSGSQSRGTRCPSPSPLGHGVVYGSVVSDLCGPWAEAPGSSVPGLPGRALAVAVSYCRKSPDPGGSACVSCIVKWT